MTKNPIVRAMLALTAIMVVTSITRAGGGAMRYRVVGLSAANPNAQNVGIAINNSGQIVGFQISPGSADAVIQALFWTNYSSTPVVLTSDGISSAAYGINSSGQIVGAV